MINKFLPFIVNLNSSSFFHKFVRSYIFSLFSVLFLALSSFILGKTFSVDHYKQFILLSSSSSAVFSFAELGFGITCIRQLANNTFSRQRYLYFLLLQLLACFIFSFSFGRFFGESNYYFFYAILASSVHLVYLYMINSLLYGLEQPQLSSAYDVIITFIRLFLLILFFVVFSYSHTFDYICLSILTIDLLLSLFSVSVIFYLLTRLPPNHHYVKENVPALIFRSLPNLLSRFSLDLFNSGFLLLSSLIAPQGLIYFYIFSQVTIPLKIVFTQASNSLLLNKKPVQRLLSLISKYPFATFLISFLFLFCVFYSVQALSFILSKPLLGNPLVWFTISIFSFCSYIFYYHAVSVYRSKNPSLLVLYVLLFLLSFVVLGLFVYLSRPSTPSTAYLLSFSLPWLFSPFFPFLLSKRLSLSQVSNVNT